MSLADDLRAGEIRAIARGMTLVEENAPAAVDLLREIFPHTGNATVIGLTGSPGAGKSSLADRMVAAYRAEGRKVGVIAVDPSSAFSGGAILGDRIRMQSHATDPGVFIRSMATRGHLGGLARASNEFIDLFDAAGYDPIVVETVGVGQDEVEVVRTADVVGVILVPGMGDGIQALKAGILEIADLFVINKADQVGADRLETELRYMLSLTENSERPTPEVHRTVAIRNEGIAELTRAFDAFVAQEENQRRQQRRLERARARFMGVLSDSLLERLKQEALPDERAERLVREIAERRLDPYSAAQQILSDWEAR